MCLAAERATMTSRRGRRVEAHRRWQSVSSMGGPEGLASAAMGAAEPVATSTAGLLGLLDKQDGRSLSGGSGGHDRHSLSVTDASNTGADVRGGRHPSVDGGCAGQQRDYDAPRQQRVHDMMGGNDDYPEIPTEDIGVFMATLVEGMRSDGMQLANSARNVVTNTFQVSHWCASERRAARMHARVPCRIWSVACLPGSTTAVLCP